MKPEAPGPGCSWSPEPFGHLGVVRAGRLGRDVLAVEVLARCVGQDAVGAVEGVGTGAVVPAAPKVGWSAGAE